MNNEIPFNTKVYIKSKSIGCPLYSIKQNTNQHPLQYNNNGDLIGYFQKRNKYNKEIYIVKYIKNNTKVGGDYYLREDFVIATELDEPIIPAIDLKEMEI